jgi:G3E family GTPase
MGQNMKPVYIINGFLESGKTEFITYTLQQPYFQIKGKTLLLLCEEGEIEYDEKILKKSHIEKILITEEASVDQASLLELDKKYHPERIIIEYNGMWNFKNFKLPQHWGLEQQITCVDAFGRNSAKFRNDYF